MILLGDEDMPLEAAAAESAPIVEEIAILYSNGQSVLFGTPRSVISLIRLLV